MASPDVPTIVICDAGPLIHLDELGCMDVFRDLAEVWIPEVVWQEVDRHRPTALRRRRITWRRIAVVPEPEPKLLALIEKLELHRGEQSALRLMQQIPQAMLLTDDAAARTAAMEMQYKVRGTLGMLIMAYHTGRRTKRQILNLLHTIDRRSTLHISDDLLEAAIALLAEETP